ncbi:hypothetical protein GJ496_008513 [Pomphorhynchus laevis]|nr:hypothetical protein GJ496_008513 [Pomphorhynchus laevis]
MQESKTLHRSYVDYNFIVSEINHMYQVRKGHPNVQTYLTHPPSPSFGQRAGNPPVSSTNNPSITSTSSSRYQSANHSNFYQQEKQKEFTEPYLLPVRSFSPHFSGNMYSTSLTSLATTMMSLTNDNINDNNSEETFQRCSSANSILASITAANNQIGISKYDRRTFATTKSLLNKRNPTTNLISSDWPPLHHHDPPPPHCHPQLSSQSNSSTTIRIQARPSSTPHHYYSYQHQNDKSKQSEVDTWSLALSNQKKQPIVDLSKRTINNELETAHEASTQQKAGTVDPVTPDADPQVVSTDSDNMADTSKSPGAMSTKAQQQKQVKGYCGYVESYPYYYKMGKMQRAFIAQRQITNTILRYQQIAANLAAATAAAVVATSSSSSSSSAQHQSSYQNNEMRALRKSSRVNMTTNNGRNQQLNYNNASRLAKKGLRNDDVKQRQAQHVLVNEGALNSGESSLQKQHQALSRQKIRTAADSNKFLFLDQCRSRCYTQIPASGSHHIIVAAGGDSGLAGGCIPSDSTSSVIYHRQESRI